MRVLRPRTVPLQSARRFGTACGRWPVASAVAAVVVVFVAACGDDGTAPVVPVAVDVPAVYVAVIDHLVMGGDEPPKTLFIEALAPSKVSLSDQAKIIKAYDEDTAVRFVDDSEEAVEDEAPRLVRSNGVLVQVGQAEVRPEYLSVTATRYVSLTESETRCFTLAQTPDTPAAVLTSTAC